MNNAYREGYDAFEKHLPERQSLQGGDRKAAMGRRLGGCQDGHRHQPTTTLPP